MGTATFSKVVLWSIVAVLLIVAAAACSSRQPRREIPPYKSRYSVDRVIAIATAAHPTCFRDNTQAPSGVSVRYIGGSKAAWEVEIACPSGYLLGDLTTGKTLYFYEGDGSLRDLYYP